MPEQNPNPPTPPENPTPPAKPWFDGIDAETIGHWDNKGFKKDDPKALVTELTKAWKGLEKHFGVPADRIIKLPEKADDEAGWKAVRERLGAPADGKDYDFAGLKYADGSEVEQGFTDVLRASLHRAGVDKTAARGIAQDLIKYSDGNESANSTERAATLQSSREALRKDWGANFEFNRLTAMQGARRALGTDERAQQIVAAMEQAIGYQDTMNFWLKIGQGTTEDTFHASGQGGMPTTMNGAAARKVELMADKDWVARYLKGDAAAVREMNNLNLLITGEAA